MVQRGSNLIEIDFPWGIFFPVIDNRKLNDFGWFVSYDEHFSIGAVVQPFAWLDRNLVSTILFAQVKN
jgi:hypothetical protein